MKYDVALSFAGEDRKYVEAVANKLKKLTVRVFYDNFETENLWGKDLYTHLQNVYQKEAKYTIIFISKYYAKKLWTNHERKVAQARAFEEASEYILPARFDDTEIEGITQTTAYINLNQISPEDFAQLIKNKLDADKNFDNTFIDYDRSPFTSNVSEVEKKNILENKTNFIFLFGKPAVGKTSIIASILYYLLSSISIEILNNLEESYSDKKYKNYLLSSIINARFPDRTSIGSLFKTEVNIRPDKFTRDSLSITFLDMSGEDLYSIKVEDDVKEVQQFPSHIDIFFKTKNLPLTFILVTSHEEARSDDLLMFNFLEYIKNKKIFSKILLLVTKQDTNVQKSEIVNFVKEFMPLTFAHIPNAINNIKGFLIGEVFENKINQSFTNYDKHSTKIVVDWIIKNLSNYQQPNGGKIKKFMEDLFNSFKL